MSSARKTGPWTSQEEALLLTVSDAEFARRTRRSVGAASSRRRKLGLPTSGQTFGPSGARVPTDPAKELTNSACLLQRIVSGSVVKLARLRGDAGDDSPVVEMDDVTAVRTVVLNALRSGLGDPPPDSHEAVVLAELNAEEDPGPKAIPPELSARQRKRLVHASRNARLAASGV